MSRYLVLALALLIAPFAAKAADQAELQKQLDQLNNAINTLINLGALQTSRLAVYDRAPEMLNSTVVIMNEMVKRRTLLQAELACEIDPIANADDCETVTGGVVVVPTNTAPVLLPISNRQSNENESDSFSASASDADGDSLAFGATTLPPGISINALTGLMAGIPDTPGVYPVTITVTDGNLPDSTNFTWTIIAEEPDPVGNAPPVLTTIQDQEDPVDVALSLGMNATDPDGDTLTYSVQSLPPGVVIDTGTGVISGTPTLVGYYQVTATVSDGTDAAQTVFYWRIIDNDTGGGSGNTEPPDPPDPFSPPVTDGYQYKPATNREAVVSTPALALPGAAIAGFYLQATESLTVTEGAYNSAAAMGGIPFAPGELAAGSLLHIVDDAGVDAPGHAEAFSHHPDGSIAWVRVTASGDVPSGGVLDRYLAPDAATDTPLATMAGNTVTIDNGSWDYEVNNASLSGSLMSETRLFVDNGRSTDTPQMNLEVNSSAMSVVRVDGQISGNGLDYTVFYIFRREDSTVEALVSFRNANLGSPNPKAYSSMGIEVVSATPLPGYLINGMSDPGNLPVDLYQGARLIPTSGGKGSDVTDFWKPIGNTRCPNYGSIRVTPTYPGTCTGSYDWLPTPSALGLVISEEGTLIQAGDWSNHERLEWLRAGDIVVSMENLPATPGAAIEVSGNTIKFSGYRGAPRSLYWGGHKTFRFAIDAYNCCGNDVYKRIQWPVAVRPDFERWRSSGALWGETRLNSADTTADFDFLTSDYAGSVELANTHGRPGALRRPETEDLLNKTAFLNWNKEYVLRDTLFSNWASAGNGSDYLNAREFVQHVNDTATIRTDGFDFYIQQPPGNYQDFQENQYDQEHQVTGGIFIMAMMSGGLSHYVDAARDYAEHIYTLGQVYDYINLATYNSSNRGRIRMAENLAKSYMALSMLGDSNAERYFPESGLDRYLDNIKPEYDRLRQTPGALSAQANLGTTSVNVDGLTNGETLRTGDKLKIGHATSSSAGRLYEYTGTDTVFAGGAATIDITPALTDTYLDNAVVTFDPTAAMCTNHPIVGRSLERGYVYWNHNQGKPNCQEMLHSFFTPHLFGDMWLVLERAGEQWAGINTARLLKLDNMRDMVLGQSMHILFEALRPTPERPHRVLGNDYLLSTPSGPLQTASAYYGYLPAAMSVMFFDHYGGSTGFFDSIGAMRARYAIGANRLEQGVPQVQAQMYLWMCQQLAGKNAATIESEFGVTSGQATDLATRWENATTCVPRWNWQDIVVTPTDNLDGTWTVTWNPPQGAVEIKIKHSTKTIVPWLGYDQLTQTYVHDPATNISWTSAENISGEPDPSVGFMDITAPSGSNFSGKWR